MENHDMLHTNELTPFSSLGFTHPFWTVQIDTIISTFIIIVILFIVSLIVNRSLKKETSIVRFIAINYVHSFKTLLEQTLKTCPQNHLAFIGSLFTFILCCNTIQIIPWCEEPTKDLNTTLALGLISFFYVQGYAIKEKGLIPYIKEYFDPFILMFPLNFIGTLTSIISLSFRLYGNIFGGFIINSLYLRMISSSIVLQSVALLSGANIIMLLLFGVFEGVIQAFVFAMLTLTYLSMEIVHDDEEDEDHNQNESNISPENEKIRS